MPTHSPAQCRCSRCPENGCWTQDAGCRTQDAGWRTLDAGHWMQDAGCRMLDAGRWTQDAGCRTQDAGCRTLDAGRRMQDAGRRMLDAFCLAGGSSSAAASHACTQHRLCGTGLSSSGETSQSPEQCLQDLNRYGSNLLGIITELWATFTQPLLLQAGTIQYFCYV